MSRNLSPTEKPLSECPQRCRDCEYFLPYETISGGTCVANDSASFVYGFESPKDRPLRMALNCYWWYANSVWQKLSQAKKDEYENERLHLFTVYRFKRTLPVIEMRDFVRHVHREGGGDLIDFSIYPNAKPIYDEVKARESERSEQE